MEYPLSWILIAKAILVEEQLWYYLTHTLGGNKGLHKFLKGNCPKANTIAWLEFELAYYDVKVKCHGDPPDLVSCPACGEGLG